MTPLVKPYIAPRDEMMPEIERVLYSGYIAMGEEVDSFEQNLGDFLQNNNVVALNSGTAALHIALLLLKIGEGDEVISTPMTAEPTNTTIAITGAKVIWADVDPSNGLLDPESVRQKITSRTKAIMLVHYAGMVCDMDRFNKLSQETGIPIIEDAAHAFGSRYNGRPIGSNSMFTCFSFQAIKHMTTVDGGALLLRNDDMLHDARCLRWFGLDKKVSRLQNDIKRAGYKYGMNNVNAAIGNVQLHHMKRLVERDISNGKFYDEALKGISGVTLVNYEPNTEPSYWLYTLKVDNRDDFCKALESRGITASQLHHRTDTHSVFAESRCDLPHMDDWYEHFVHIPCGWWVDDEIRTSIVDAIKLGW